MKTSIEPYSWTRELRLLVQCGHRVWGLVSQQQKWALGSAAFIMAITSAGNTAVALLLGYLVDNIRLGMDQHWPPEEMYYVAGIVLGMLALVYLVREVLHVIRRYLVENSCTQISRDTQVQVVAHLMKVNLLSLTQEKVGALHGKIMRSVDGLVRFLRVMFLDLFPAIFTGAFALAAAITKQPLLGLVMLGVIPTAIYLTIRQLVSQKGVRLKLMRDCEEIDGTVVEQLGGMEYVRVANTHALEVQRLDRLTEKKRNRELRHHFQMSLFGCVKALNEGFFHIIVLATATYFAINNAISFGDILTFSVLFLNVMTPLSEIHRLLDEGHEASLRINDLEEMLQTPVDRSYETCTLRQPRLEVSKPAIQLDNLIVEYDTGTGVRRRALQGITLEINHGEVIGVAGCSGSGKSTWIKVLLRLLHPLQGHVKLGGVPLEAVSRADLARLVAYVGQNPFVFSGTVADNIQYGNGETGPESVQHAAELAHLHDEILQMPGGYHALIAERGQNLSGGQRQRLAIARVLLKQAPILILDEATSALDNISERIVQRSLGITSSDRTTILIAHRLSTLRDCDRILVFDNGQVVEIGSYHELVQRNGLFAELVRSAETGVDEDNSHKVASAAV